MESVEKKKREKKTEVTQREGERKAKTERGKKSHRDEVMEISGGAFRSSRSYFMVTNYSILVVYIIILLGARVSFLQAHQHNRFVIHLHHIILLFLLSFIIRIIIFQITYTVLSSLIFLVRL